MKKQFNYFLFFIVIFLLGFSLFFFACLSAPASLQRFGNTNYYLFHQILSGLLPALILGYRRLQNFLRFFKKMGTFIGYFNIFALFLVFVPKIGSRGGGASRWIGIGRSYGAALRIFKNYSYFIFGRMDCL